MALSSKILILWILYLVSILVAGYPNIAHYEGTNCRGSALTLCEQVPSGTCCAIDRSQGGRVSHNSGRSVAFNPLHQCAIGMIHKATTGNDCEGLIMDTVVGTGSVICLSQRGSEPRFVGGAMWIEMRIQGSIQQCMRRASVQNKRLWRGWQNFTPQSLLDAVGKALKAGSRQKRDHVEEATELDAKSLYAEDLTTLLNDQIATGRLKCKGVSYPTLFGWEDSSEGVWVLETDKQVLNEWNRFSMAENSTLKSRANLLQDFGATFYNHWSHHPKAALARDQFYVT